MIKIINIQQSMKHENLNWYFCENFQYDEYRKTKKRINISQTLIDKKYFIFHKQIYEQKKICIFDKKHIKKT